uniref:Uncharacterized protein n=1 Tax=Globisporangium ultimum (strain ATCC 200006 / CBS 805.95 / DAOM BR144) TaxID=431595 RepID=K3WE05_GLOUD
MMMTAQHSSPKLSTQMTALSVKRPSLTPLKRKLSTDEDTASPTSFDELCSSSSSSADESSVISPKKKVKAESTTAVISSAMSKLGEDSTPAKEEQQRQTPESPASAAYVPFAFNEAPATPLSDEELEILNYFLA